MSVLKGFHIVRSVHMKRYFLLLKEQNILLIINIIEDFINQILIKETQEKMFP